MPQSEDKPLKVPSFEDLSKRSFEERAELIGRAPLAQLNEGADKTAPPDK